MVLLFPFGEINASGLRRAQETNGQVTVRNSKNLPIPRRETPHHEPKQWQGRQVFRPLHNRVGLPLCGRSDDVTLQAATGRRLHVVRPIGDPRGDQAPADVWQPPAQLGGRCQQSCCSMRLVEVVLLLVASKGAAWHVVRWSRVR